MKTDWQKRRSRFNHDWLKNQLIPKLGMWINILDDEIEDDDFVDTFVDTVLSSVEPHLNEALLLPADFVNEMSPRIFLNYHPLSDLDDQEKTLLGDLIHHLWLERYSVLGLVDDATTAAKATIEAYSCLQNALASCSDVRDINLLRLYRDQFATLLNACRLLSKAIEKFPSEVKPV